MRGRGDDRPTGLGVNGTRPRIDKPQSGPKERWDIPLLVGVVLVVVVYLLVLLSGQRLIEPRQPTETTVQGLDAVPPGPPVPFPRPLAKPRD